MKQLSETFGITYKEPERNLPAKIETPEPVVVEGNSDQKEDYNLSRKTFKRLITKGEEAIDELYELAKSSEHPRSYEVLATLMKTVADTTRDLYDLQKKTKDLGARGPEGDISQTQNISVDKAVFVGTTADVIKRITDENV